MLIIGSCHIFPYHSVWFSTIKNFSDLYFHLFCEDANQYSKQGREKKIYTFVCIYCITDILEVRK